MIEHKPLVRMTVDKPRRLFQLITPNQNVICQAAPCQLRNSAVELLAIQKSRSLRLNDLAEPNQLLPLAKLIQAVRNRDLIQRRPPHNSPQLRVALSTSEQPLRLGN